MKKANQSALTKLALGGILGATLVGCGEESTGGNANSSNEEALAKFIADCEAAGHKVEEHATCEGKNSCAGSSYDVGSGELTTHDCAGKNTCAGASCIEEGDKSSSTEGSSSSEVAANAAALKVFIETCEADGHTVEEHSTCKGTGSCAGASFDLSSGATIDHDCAGKNNCAGATCLTASESSSSSMTSGTSSEASLTLAKFKEDCEASGGTVEEHAVCAGKNTCAGSSFDSETGSVTEHTCAGKNTCAGATCKS